MGYAFITDKILTLCVDASSENIMPTRTSFFSVRVGRLESAVSELQYPANTRNELLFQIDHIG